MTQCCLGLDLSLRGTGYAMVSDGGLVEKGTIATPDRLRGAIRLAFLRHRFWGLLARLPDPDMIVIEDYAMSGKGRVFNIGEWGGIVRLELLIRGRRTYLASPTSLKSFVTGKGNASKDDMLSRLSLDYGLSFDNDNEADAFGLAIMGETFLSNAGVSDKAKQALDAMVPAFSSFDVKQLKQEGWHMRPRIRS